MIDEALAGLSDDLFFVTVTSGGEKVLSLARAVVALS